MKKSNIYPVITLYQPWATWIMRRWKDIESRTHNRFECLKHKELLIHAGKNTDLSAINNPYLTPQQLVFNPDEMVNGFILGMVYVNDTGKLSLQHEKRALIECENTERWGLFLNVIEKFENPIPEIGEMGIWYYDLEKKEKVKKPKIETLKLF